MSSYIIIGAGNFGASTALSLLQRQPGASVTLIDTQPFPNPRAASHDVSKIVRDDYPDSLYMRMLGRAMAMWREDPLFAPFYHQVGMLRADSSTFGEGSIAAYEAMGIDHKSEFLPVEEVRRRWNGALATADLTGVDTVLYNPSVGFAEADKALNAILQKAVDVGVKYVIGETETLLFGKDDTDHKACLGVKLTSGLELRADKVLIAAGARSASLLAASAPHDEKIQAGERLVATGAVSFHAKLEGEQRKKFANIPVFKNCLPQVKGEGMSIFPDGLIKFNCDLCFTNYVDVPGVPGGKMSVAPDVAKLNVWTGPDFIKFFEDRARKVFDGLYGDEVKDIKIDAYRMCWDASTPTHDFLVTPHPHCDGLYVASGGSFHGWKFLPVIGDYVADMMHGDLASEYAERWAWDKKTGDGHSANPTYKIIGDLQDWL